MATQELHHEMEYESLLCNIGVLKEELRVTTAARNETLKIFSRLVDAVTSTPEPLFRRRDTTTPRLQKTNSNLLDAHKKEKRRSFKWNKRDSHTMLPASYMSEHIWGAVLAHLDYLSLWSVCSACKRFSELVHSVAIQPVLDEQTCIYSWQKRVEKIPKISPWLPSPNSIMPLYLFPTWGISYKSKETKSAEKLHRQIEDMIRSSRREFNSTRLILVVGPSRSGKTTFVRNFIHPWERNESYKAIVRDFTVSSMRNFLENQHLLPCPTLKAIEDLTLTTIPNIWEDTKIRNAYFESIKASPDSTAHYFFDKAANILETNYCPTDSDLRRLYISEPNLVSENSRKIEGLCVKVVQVKNFANHSKRLRNLFSEAFVVYLCISLTELNQSLQKYVRTLASMGSWCVVVFTKLDAFQNKVLAGQLTSCSNIFDSYLGDKTDMKAVLSFIEDQIRNMSELKLKRIIFVNNFEPTNHWQDVFMSTADR